MTSDFHMCAVLFWAECVVAFFLMVVLFFIFLSYAIPFVEERLPKVTHFGIRTALVILLMSLLIIPAGFGNAAFVSTCVTNCFWLSVLARGCPYISIVSWDLFGAVVGTMAAHFCWICAFIKVPMGAFASLTYYLAFVWGIPVIVTVSFCVVDGRGRPRSERKRSTLKSLMGRTFGLIRSLS